MNPYQRYLGAAMQMLATLLGFVWLGRYLDAHFQWERPWGTLTCALLGVVFALFALIKSLPK